MVRPAVQGGRLSFLDAETELGGDDDLVPDRRERLPDPFLTGMGAVDLRRVEKGHAPVEGPADQGDHVLFVVCAAIIAHHGQTAQPDGGDLQTPQPAGRQGSGLPSALRLCVLSGRPCRAGQGVGKERHRAEGQPPGQKTAASRQGKFLCSVHDCLHCKSSLRTFRIAGKRTAKNVRFWQNLA